MKKALRKAEDEENREKSPTTGSTAFDLISGLFAYVILGKEKRPN